MDDRFADAPIERGGDENTQLSEAMKRFANLINSVQILRPKGKRVCNNIVLVHFR
jgi:hypothetical protein